jgi:hypothetical protein
VGYFGDYSPTLAQFQALPSQSAALAAAVRRAALAQEQMSQVPSGKKIQFWKESGLPTLGQDMFGVYMQLLKWDPIAPQVRAAVFRDLATLPGVKSAGPMSDPLGRPGFGIAMASSQGQAGRQAGEEEILVVALGPRLALAPAQVVSYDAVISAGWISTAPALPPLSRQFSMAADGQG